MSEDWTAPTSSAISARRTAAARDLRRARIAYEALFPDHVWVNDPDDGTGYCRRCLLPSARWSGDSCPDEWAFNARAPEVVARAESIERARPTLPAGQTTGGEGT